MSYKENSSFSKQCWEKIKNYVACNLEGVLNARCTSIQYTNWTQDALLKIDSIMNFINAKGESFTKNIQFRFWNNYSNVKDYLTVRTHSYSSSLDTYVESEFYKGENIDYFVQGIADSKTGDILDYTIIDWKVLFPHFNKDIFTWENSNSMARGYNTYFYYEISLGVDSDSNHKNKMITIPLKKGTIVNRIDKSIGNLWPETIIRPLK